MPVQKPDYINLAIDAALANQALEITKAQQRRLSKLKEQNELPDDIGYGTIQLLLAGMNPDQYETFVNTIHNNNPNFWSTFLITPLPPKLYDTVKTSGKLDSFVSVIGNKLRDDRTLSLSYISELGKRFRGADDVEQVYNILAKPRSQNPANSAQNNQRSAASKAPVYVGISLEKLNEPARQDYISENPKKGRVASAWESVVRFFVPKSLANRWFPGNAALANKLRGYIPPVAAEQPVIPAITAVDSTQAENSPILNPAPEMATTTTSVLTSSTDAVAAPAVAPTNTKFKPYVGGSARGFKPIAKSDTTFKPAVSLSPASPVSTPVVSNDKQANTAALIPPAGVVTEVLPETTPVVKPSFKPAVVESARGFKPVVNSSRFKPPILPRSPTPETTVTITIEQRNLSPQDLQNMQPSSRVKVEELAGDGSSLPAASGNKAGDQLQLALQQASRFSNFAISGQHTPSKRAKKSGNSDDAVIDNAENQENVRHVVTPVTPIKKLAHDPRFIGSPRSPQRTPTSCAQEAARGLASSPLSPGKIRI